MRLYKMDDALSIDNKLIKMGATGNPNITRLATLQERKKTIEETLAKCNQELKQICLQEADLTGIIPTEMPLEPGESPPLIRRRIGTAYQLPENLIKSSKDESFKDLELQIQVHANMAEAALGLANEHNISKTLRRQHMAEYQQHKIQFTTLQEKLSTLKDKAQQNELHKQKKKPRPTEQDDNVSVGTNMNEPFGKSDLRNSMRSNKCDTDVEQRYLLSNSRMTYKNVTNSYMEGSFSRQEESIARGLYALSFNGYKNYIERQESLTNNHIGGYNTLQYSHQLHQHSPVNSHYSQTQPYQPNPRPNTLYNYPINQTFQVPQLIKNHHSPQSTRSQHRQSSPNLNTTKMFYSQNPDYRLHSESENFLTANPHQIQPHQQYEHMPLGLGGYWKRLESGQTVWCNSSPTESSWQRDKRFGSLDRRKNKRLHKRVSPSVGNKSATLASVPVYTDQIRTPSIKSPQVISRRSQDNRQLVRTQSLGSVGGQTVDSVWPSDDNSSCESDNRSINEAGQNARKQKQKEWMETFLDGPVSPTHSVISRSQSALPSVLSPEEKYIVSPPQPIPPPQASKPPLEIPAESNPSLRIPETNIELFNNNIPKNCTIVQAGHYKPYHEETKPFEMSDYYKYSAKFKKSPQKQQEDTLKKSQSGAPFQKNLNEAFDKSVKNHNFSPGSPRLDNSVNSSFDLSQNVAERFSDEMNAWYKNQKLQIESNGSGTSKGKSTATLV
ncbi:uncharacterized protein LOC123006131 [Tribolium madens]|uniref:uncharacterized protein LOC123006131 n=1 Tax=Tribolium madens TaxID=41895 RepID=UPI001CF76632|nr:uncharacterized protein LOC123006131 [Tribolium madens]